MNGLLGWALAEIGFKVTRRSGTPNREESGSLGLGTHLLLEVELDGEQLLADVGFGDGLRRSVQIDECAYEQDGLTYQLESREDGFWRFHNHAHTTMPYFDFKRDLSTEESEQELAQGCAGLQANANSPFRKTLIAFRYTPTTIDTLVGKVAVSISPKGRKERTLETMADVQRDLEVRFGLIYVLVEHPTGGTILRMRPSV